MVGGERHPTTVEDLLELAPEERAREGVFLAFQYPVEIPGVNNAYLLKAALNATAGAPRRRRSSTPSSSWSLMRGQDGSSCEMDESFLNRGGQRRLLAVARRSATRSCRWRFMQPRLAVLDETDSGLDIDAMKVVAHGVNSLRSPERAMVLVTHYQRLLDYIEPDFVHVLSGGRIVRTGGKGLALELEERGYDWVDEAAHA